MAAPTAVDERAQLLRMIADQRTAVRNALSGLTEEQARSTPSASGLSLAVIAKHLAQGEYSGVAVRIGGRPEQGSPEQTWHSGFVLGPDETVADVLAHWDQVAAVTEEVVRAEPSLDRVVEVPAEVRPWLQVEVITVRWLLLHLIEESARHAGHADVIRESIDGKGAWELAGRG